SPLVPASSSATVSGFSAASCSVAPRSRTTLGSRALSSAGTAPLAGGLASRTSPSSATTSPLVTRSTLTAAASSLTRPSRPTSMSPPSSCRCSSIDDTSFHYQGARRYPPGPLTFTASVSNGAFFGDDDDAACCEFLLTVSHFGISLLIT